MSKKHYFVLINYRSIPSLMWQEVPVHLKLNYRKPWPIFIEHYLIYPSKVTPLMDWYVLQSKSIPSDHLVCFKLTRSVNRFIFSNVFPLIHVSHSSFSSNLTTSTFSLNLGTILSFSSVRSKRTQSSKRINIQTTQIWTFNCISMVSSLPLLHTQSWNNHSCLGYSSKMGNCLQLYWYSHTYQFG